MRRAHDTLSNIVSLKANSRTKTTKIKHKKRDDGQDETDTKHRTKCARTVTTHIDGTALVDRLLHGANALDIHYLPALTLIIKHNIFF